MSETENALVKQEVLEEIIGKAVQIPFVKVDRRILLKEQFAKFANVEEIIEKGPIGAGVSKEKLDEIAKKIIFIRTSQSSIASFASGIPGGLMMGVTVPADTMQFFGMTLRLAQELSYIYGAEDLWKDGKLDDDKVRNQLIIYCGVMFGVSGAVSGLRVLTTQIAKTAAKKIPGKALTKTFWYPMLKKICKFVGVKITKDTIGKGAGKVIPVIGGVISGGMNFASMMPMANKLKDALESATFNYTEEEYAADIEIIQNPVVEEDAIEKVDLKEKIMQSKEGVTNFISKIGKKNKDKNVDPYEEIKKLKELLDSKIISEEEFAKKKKELLNI